ncbi:MAG: GNAT family N-acetyltransferase [Verrucomicrobiota bacterium]
MTLNYRQASRAELDLAIDWAAGEGWNPGLHDGDLFWETDPTGFVCIEREGEVIGTGSIVRYGEDFGFMGFFMVRPDLRGHGIGRDFWIWRRDTLRTRLRSDAAIGMDGVFDMQPFYAKGGFAFTHRNLRMEGMGRESAPEKELVRLTDLAFAEILAYDQRHFGFNRSTFLKSWIQPPGGAAFGLVEEGQLQGMGVIRPCQTGFKIGPLFADTPKAAEHLFGALSNHAANQPIYLDIPETNADAVALAVRHELKEVFGCARMYHGPAPGLPWKSIFGITTFELG